MKNIKLLIIVLIPLLGLNSCFDSFLEEKPYSFLAPENVYTSEDGLLAALSGVYYDLAAGNNSYARASCRCPDCNLGKSSGNEDS